jgi:Zn-dependent protease with chaperone function
MSLITLPHVPGRLAAPSTSPTARPDHRQVLAALDVSVPQVKPPAAYGLFMGVLAVCLVLLPVLYLALVAFLGWLVVWHLFQAYSSFSQGPYFVFHLPMAFLGGLLLLFLVKPVFFRARGGDDGVLPLDPGQEPLLFAFVQKLCAATGSKAPDVIEVDCEPNAGARLRSGLGGIFGGRLVLRVGLPLAGALSVRQFAGVLAHEFGHFNQRSGMTGSYLIRRLNAFFAKVVFERDRLDEKLARLRVSGSTAGRWFYYVAVALIEPARGVLWLMLLAGESLTCGVLRRMEYDADNVEAQVAGVRDFAITNRAMTFLNIASRRAHYDMAAAWEEQRLADDLPRLIVDNAGKLAEHRGDILKMIEEEKTHWFDTHPSHNDRVRNVERGGAAGLVECDTPAKDLFGDFAGLCRRATEAYYKSILGADMAEAKVVAASALIEERSGQRQAFKALRRFFRDNVVGMRPVLPSADAEVAPHDARKAAEALGQSRQAMLAAAEALGPAVEQFEEAAGAMHLARAQVALCGIFHESPKAADMRAEANALLRRHEPQHIHAVHKLAAFERAARERLSGGLRLIQNDDVAARLGEGGAAARKSVAQLVTLCRSFEPYLPNMQRLGELATGIRVFCSAYNDEQPYEPLVERILESTREAVGILRRVQTELAYVPYPFSHGTDGVSVGVAIVQKLPDPQDPVETHAAAVSALDRWYDVTFRTIAKLAEWAEKAETAVGLEPLADPPEQHDKQAEAETKEATRDSRRYWLSYSGRATAGLALVVGLIWMSVSPPALPSMPWGDGSHARRPGERYRPAGFHTSVRNYTHYTPPSSNRYGPQPWRPGSPQPGHPQAPGGAPYPNRQPGYTPPTPPRPQPPTYSPRPSSPGGGRYSPGGASPGRPSPGGPSPGRR